MGPDAAKLLEQALKLSPEERSEVADGLLRSLDDDTDDLDDEERARLHHALAASEDDFAAGDYRDASDVISDLRRQRK